MLFMIGGIGYVILEILWRGRSYASMFVAGGVSFLLLGKLDRRLSGRAKLLRGVAGAAVITLVELLVGIFCNRNFRIWDYRRMPLNFRGQVCLPFSLLWIPISLGAMAAHRRLERILP